MNATQQTPTEQKFLNRKQYPIILIDGSGGRVVVEPGEVVGKVGERLVAKNGLEVYAGERPVGKMARVQAKQMLQEQACTHNQQVKRINGDPVQPIGAPKIDGAQNADLLPHTAAGEKYMEKSGVEWLQAANNNDLNKLSKGQLQGLAAHFGANMSQVNEKVLLVQNLTTLLRNLFGNK